MSNYNHAIGGLMLAEVYGMAGHRRNELIRTGVVKAIAITRKYQTTHKANPVDIGGARYMFHNHRMDSDLSVTSWHLMFYRAAKNAEFEVPSTYIDDAMNYVRRCYSADAKTFSYCAHSHDVRFTRAMCGAGILSLSLGGEHETEIAKSAGEWMLRQSFVRYNTNGGISARHGRDQYHYSVYYATLGMLQLGGHYWSQYYPPVVRTLIENQQADGAWQSERAQWNFGYAYPTSLSIMALTVPYQIVPIYQR